MHAEIDDQSRVSRERRPMTNGPARSAGAGFEPMPWSWSDNMPLGKSHNARKFGSETDPRVSQQRRVHDYDGYRRHSAVGCPPPSRERSF